MAGNRVTIQLTQAQIDRVFRDANSDGLLGLSGEVEAIAGAEVIEFLASLVQANDPRFSRSLLQGLMILACFPVGGTGRAVTDVADELGLGISTTHRYASTLLEVGLLERDPMSRQYRRVVLR
jgi:DNA-binding MarR family transcriptional regulator